MPVNFEIKIAVKNIINSTKNGTLVWRRGTLDLWNGVEAESYICEIVSDIRTLKVYVGIRDADKGMSNPPIVIDEEVFMCRSDDPLLYHELIKTIKDYMQKHNKISSADRILGR